MKARVLCAVCAIAMSQAGYPSQWKHEVVVEHVWQHAGQYAVNREGIPIYTIYEMLPGVANRLPQAYRYKTNLTQKYFPGISQGFTKDINGNGQVAWNGWTDESEHAMVDGRDFFAEVHGPAPRDQFATGVHGVDGAGTPFWSWSKIGEFSHLYHGTDEIYQGMQLTRVRKSVINRNGHIAFLSYSALTDYEEDVYHDGANLSASLLGGNQTMIPLVSINDSNHVLWGGGGDNTGGEIRVYLDDQLYARSELTKPSAFPVKITNSGHIAWLKGTSARWYMQVDGQDFSYVNGHGPRIETPQTRQWLAESGDVLYEGGEPFYSWNQSFIVKNHEDISTPIIGERTEQFDRLYAVGMDDAGNALWYGQGNGTNHRMYTFVNDYNLSLDYLDDRPFLATGGLAIGPNGHVLWQVLHSDGFADFILSTPVPEPSAVLLLVGAALWGAGMSRKR